MTSLVLAGDDRRSALVVAPLLSALLARLRALARVAPWALVPLLVSMPPPILVPDVDVIHQWPILVAQVVAVAALIAWIGAWLPGLAALLAWMLVRTTLGGWPEISAQTLVLVLVGVVVYLAAVWAPLEGWGRRAESAFLVGLGAAMLVHGALGVVNLFGVYPLLSIVPDGMPHTLVIDQHAYGLPHGQLSHPNHWALLMAFGVPLLWRAVRGAHPIVRATLMTAALGLVATGRSRIALAVALLALIALLLRTPTHRRLTLATTAALVAWGLAAQVALLVGRTTGAMAWSLTGGRWEAWELAFPTLWHWKWVGTGLGHWESWALSPDGLAGFHGAFAGWFTIAHSEPLQTWFELGLIGVACGTWAVATLARDAALVWTSDDPTGQALVAIAGMALVAMWVTIPFRIPILAVTALAAMARVQVRARAHRLAALGAPTGG